MGVISSFTAMAVLSLFVRAGESEASACWEDLKWIMPGFVTSLRCCLLSSQGRCCEGVQHATKHADGHWVSIITPSPKTVSGARTTQA